MVVDCWRDWQDFPFANAGPPGAVHRADMPGGAVQARVVTGVDLQALPHYHSWLAGILVRRMGISVWPAGKLHNAADQRQWAIAAG